MGDTEQLTEPDATGASDQDPFWRSFRFGVGLAALFLSTVAVTLAILAVATTVVPRWHSTVVASASMEPALRRGDTVAYVERDIDGVGVADVVVFDDDNGRKTIHRVVSVNEDATLTTRGDANPTNDSSPVTADELHGAGRLVIPWVGLLRLWWLDGRHALVISILIGIALSLRATRLASGPHADPWIGEARADPAAAWINDDAPRPEYALLEPDRRDELLENDMEPVRAA